MNKLLIVLVIGIAFFVGRQDGIHHANEKTTEAWIAGFVTAKIGRAAAGSSFDKQDCLDIKNDPGFEKDTGFSSANALVFVISCGYSLGLEDPST